MIAMILGLIMSVQPTHQSFQHGEITVEFDAGKRSPTSRAIGQLCFWATQIGAPLQSIAYFSQDAFGFCEAFRDLQTDVWYFNDIGISATRQWRENGKTSGLSPQRLHGGITP